LLRASGPESCGESRIHASGAVKFERKIASPMSRQNSANLTRSMPVSCGVRTLLRAPSPGPFSLFD
jgi:hypothetical protein